LGRTPSSARGGLGRDLQPGLVGEKLGVAAADPDLIAIAPAHRDRMVLVNDAAARVRARGR